jgi:DNA-directed RNA polymerase subunit RPC12/RpoP
MPDVKTFFRHCPSCGRRFEIRLESKRLIQREKYIEPGEATPVGHGGLMYPAVLEENAPTTVYLEEFQYTYKCKHCGHEWSELREKQDEEPPPMGYGGA